MGFPPRSVNYFLFLFLWCISLNLVSSEINNTASTRNLGSSTQSGYNTNVSGRKATTPEATTVAKDQAVCSSYISKLPGLDLVENEIVLAQCECAISPQDVNLVCPGWSFLSGEEYIYIVQHEIDYSETNCAVKIKFKVRSNLKVGRKHVDLRCYMPGVYQPIATFDAYVNSPAAEGTRFNAYIVFAVVAFVVLTVGLLGFLFYWLVKNRRRAEQVARCRSPFIRQRNGQTASSLNHGFQADSPPPYNEATLPMAVTGYQPPVFIGSRSEVMKDGKANPAQPEKTDK